VIDPICVAFIYNRKHTCTEKRREKSKYPAELAVREVLEVQKMDEKRKEELAADREEKNNSQQREMLQLSQQHHKHNYTNMQVQQGQKIEDKERSSEDDICADVPLNYPLFHRI
jgi:hypothetical protein